MTKGEAKVLETEVVIFPAEFGSETQAPTTTVEENVFEAAAEKRPVKVDVENRFARLKKSLRKRSASIL